MATDLPHVGDAIVLTIDGQKLTGTVTAIRSSALEVSLPLRQAAKGYHNVTATTAIGGRDVVFELGRSAHFANLVVEVPLHHASAAPVVPQGADRRRFYRLAVNVGVEVIEQIGRDREFVVARGETVNLSGGGFLARFAKPVPEGNYSFRVHLADEAIVVNGRMLPATQGTTVAPVEFVGVSEVDRSKVIRFIFGMMRKLKEGLTQSHERADEKKKGTGELPRYKLRRQRFYQPPRIRYW